MHEGYSLNEWLALFGVKLISLVAGFAGATVGLAVRPRLTIVQLIAALVGGVATAAYMGPAASYYLSLPASIDGAVAFLLGIAGLVIAAGVVEIAKALPRIAIDTIRRVSGTKGDGQ